MAWGPPSPLCGRCVDRGSNLGCDVVTAALWGWQVIEDCLAVENAWVRVA
jgi:hypothetical protein